MYLIAKGNYTRIFFFQKPQAQEEFLSYDNNESINYVSHMYGCIFSLWASKTSYLKTTNNFGIFHCKFSHVSLSTWVKCQRWCLTVKMDKSTMLLKLSKFITLDISWQMHLPAGNINATFVLRQPALPFLTFW